MKYIRLFPSASIRDAVLAEIEHSVLSYTEGEGMLMKSVTTPPEPPEPVADPTIPFYIEDVSGNANTVQIKKSSNRAPTLTIEKSTDGITWETMGTTSTTGISATIPANGKLYLRCNTNACGASYLSNRITTTGNCNVGGNIMSLLYGSNFTGEETAFPSGTFTFYGLFSSNTHLVDASDLLLPATTLSTSCYASMFDGCTSLTTAPELPVTALADNCYGSMFNNCASLTTAPTLPATTLVYGCYSGMFSGCTSLNYIKCLATDISADYCTNNWVTNVSSTGTFVKNPSMSGWTTGESGIPSGWTVEDAA